MIHAPSEAVLGPPSTADEPISEVVPIRREPASIALSALLSEGLGTLLSALGVAVIACQLTHGLQFVNQERRDAMLPFNLSDPTNTLFQYAIGMAVALGILLAYGPFVAHRLGPVAKNLDLLAATALLLVAGLTPAPRLLVAALVVRLAAGARLVLGADRAPLSPSAPLARLAAWSPLTGLLVCAAGLTLILPSGVSAAIRTAPAWLLLAAAAPAALFLLEETLNPTALRWERRIGLALGLVMIPLLTFRISAAYFDFATIVGPVNDLMRGKDITAGVVSTYGFLFSYALAGVFSVLRVSDPFIGTAVLNAVAFSAGYAAILLFLAHRIQRISLCLATLGVLLAFNFFHLHVPMSWLPQSGFLRFGGVLPVFLLLYAWSSHPESRPIEWAFAGSTALAVFWTLEVGGYITLGLAAALGHQLWFRAPEDRRPLRLMAKTAACVALLAGCFTLRIWLRHGHWPVWGELLHFQQAYSAGLAMSPPTSIERWPLPILIYLATLFVAVRAGRSMRHAAAWVFLAAFGLASMVYPLGKGGIWDLGRVALPAILLSAACVDFLFRERTPSGARREQLFDISSLAPFAWFAAYACAACLVYAEVSPPLALAARLESSHQKPIAHEAPSWHAFLRSADANTLFESDLAAIREFVPPNAALSILSRNDTLYYVFGERKAAFRNSFYPHFFFKSDIDEIVQTLETADLGYLFVDRSAFQVYENKIDVTIGQQVKERLRSKYRLVKHAGFLDIYQRI